MINAEFDIYDTVSDALRDMYGKNIFISGETVSVPSKFPAATIVEMSNTVYSKMTTTTIENAARLLFQVDVYSNLVGYKKSQAKEIMSVIDDAFASMNFTRTMLNPVQNLEDATIYRLTARYEAVIDKDFWLYTN